jgi:predicted nucleotidyltransferase
MNIKVVEKVAKALEEINEEVIYVGGAIIHLYATEDGADQPRPTIDIDISVHISTYTQMDKLRVRLEKKQIYPAPEENIMYRYTFEGILIDFIPIKDTPLGPTNRWFMPGFKRAIPYSIGEIKINILPASLFLATKWEAHMNRGNDPRMSHDFEDIMYVLDNNTELLADIKQAEKEVQDFLREMSEEILSDSSVNEIIECHLNSISAEERAELIIKKLELIANLNQ